MTVHMPDHVTVVLPPRDDLSFAARMTQVQFAALASRASPDRLTAELGALLTARPRTRGAKCDAGEVGKWLQNGWSTENLLSLSASTLSGDALRHSRHWAFPQAYYSTYALTIAYFRAVGFTEESHAATIRKYGAEALVGHYPSAIACVAVGALTAVFHGLCCVTLPTSLHFNSSDPSAVDGQIAQFLRATRAMDLKAKKADFKLTTKRGTKKKAFSPTDWAQVAKALGPTSILSLLYRKRIKANYRDIDTFLHPDLDAAPLYHDLLRIVGALNWTHETFIASALGIAELEAALSRMPVAARARPERRLPLVRAIAA
jgi:hypothetical protein